MTENTLTKDRREGFKLLGEHRAGCRAQHDTEGIVFVVTDTAKPLDFRQKKTGGRGGSTMWWRFVCNDTRCEAVLLVRWDRLARFINDVQESA